MKLSQITTKRNATFNEIFTGIESLRIERSKNKQKPLKTLENLYTAAYSILYNDQTGRLPWQGHLVVKEYKGNKAYNLIKKVVDYIKQGNNPTKASFAVIQTEGETAYPAN